MRLMPADQAAVDTCHGTAPPPRLLRRAEAAHYLRISTAQLDLLRAMGEICPVPMPGRKGRAIRTPLYDRLALDAAVDRWSAGGGNG